MDKAITIFKIIFDNILAKPEFLIGLLVLVGYLLMGKTLIESLAGFIKAAVGYMVLQIGSSGMVKGFNPILNGLMSKYQLKAAVIDSNFGFAAANSAIESIGASLSWTMMVLLIGFAVNILLVALKRITKVRTLFTTGHIMVKQAGFLTWMVFFALPGYRNLTGALIIGILIGLYWSVFSNLTVKAMEDLAGGERVFAVGHAQMFAVWLTNKIAGKIGNKEHSVEELKLPKSIKVMSDNIVGTSVIMLLMFGSILIALGPQTMAEVDPDGTKGILYATYILSKSLSFTVNFIVLQTGVKMFVAEITESFEGISSKLLKGAVPAVDCAATYGFAAPNTVLIGFLFGTLGQIITIAGLVIFRSPVMIISGFVPLFFDNATIAVFANNKGGLKAAVILPFLNGVVQVLGGAVGVLMFELYTFGGWYGNTDFSTVWLLFGFLFKTFAIPGVIICMLVMLAIPQIQYWRNKENYF